MAKEHRWRTTAGEGGARPVVLKRWSVPTGEPENTARVPSGAVGGWGKRRVSNLARSLPNLLRRARFRQQLKAGVRPHPIISLDGIIVSRYHGLMIKTFACPETEKIAIGQRSRKLPSDIQSVARRKLSYLKNAKTLQDLRIPPANRLEALQGDRRGQYSIRINDQWRICFVWCEGDAYDVEIVDYH